MGRNREFIRQWTLLQRVASARGSTIPKLAHDLGVSTRTIRRDLEALQQSGFPIYDEVVNGTKFWRLKSAGLSALARTGLTLAEVAALYMSRTVFECFAGTDVQHDVQSAFEKLEGALSPAMKKFVERLPQAIAAKRQHAKRQHADTYEITAGLLNAIVSRHVVSMQYYSAESRREKLYAIHPYRLIHAQGGLYVIAFVPAYSEVRTFAVERIKRANTLEDTFEPVGEL